MVHAPDPNAGSIQLVQTPDGVTIVAREWGNPAGPPILLIHGVGQCHLSFSRQMSEDLARDFRMVAYDTRGHGASDKPLDPAYYQSGRRWADEVKAVIDAKQLDQPVLVGWSMGGRIIGEFLAAFGDAKLGGINFVAARAIPEPAFSGTAALNLPVARANDLGSRITAVAGFLQACYHQQPDAAGFATALAYNMLPPPEVITAIRGWPAAIAAIVAALRAVRVPTLVTHGRLDKVVLPAAAERTANLISAAQLSWYEGCGHSPFFEDAPRFNRELAAFVGSITR